MIFLLLQWLRLKPDPNLPVPACAEPCQRGGRPRGSAPRPRGELGGREREVANPKCHGEATLGHVSPSQTLLPLRTHQNLHYPHPRTANRPGWGPEQGLAWFPPALMWEAVPARLHGSLSASSSPAYTHTEPNLHGQTASPSLPACPCVCTTPARTHALPCTHPDLPLHLRGSETPSFHTFRAHTGQS